MITNQKLKKSLEEIKNIKVEKIRNAKLEDLIK